MARVIAFSGGRSSAYMLHILRENGIAKDDYIIFANTGKEKNETLDFVHEIETRWEVNIIWLESIFHPYDLEKETMTSKAGFKVVTYETASRNGEPFAALIDWVNCGTVPNRNSRFCTKYLKEIPIKRYLESIGVYEYDTILGIRYDEPKRWRGKYDFYGNMPLVDFQVTEKDVFKFWSAQPFDLKLKQYQGNCDLCHLKSFKKLKTLIADNPAAADWWIEQEEKTKSTFFSNGLGFTDLKKLATSTKFERYQDQRANIENDLFDNDLGCFCGD